MGNTPLWTAIARALREEIAEGRYAPGDKLPTEALLSERFGVNRHTVRHALSALVDEGLVRTRRGAGAFVTMRPADYPLGKRVRFTENLRRAGRLPGRELLGMEVRVATEDEAAVLAVAPGARILTSHGKSTADGVAMSMSEAIYPLERLPGLEAALSEGLGVTHALKAVGIEDYTRSSTRVSAVLATATQAVVLQVSEGAPLLKTTSLNVDTEGVPVEFGRTWFAGDRITLTLEE